MQKFLKDYELRSINALKPEIGIVIKDSCLYSGVTGLLSRPIKINKRLIDKIL